MLGIDIPDGYERRFALISLLLGYFFLLSELDLSPAATLLPDSCSPWQVTPCEEQICQFFQHINHAAVHGRSPQPGFLKAELQLDHAEGMLTLTRM